MDHFQKTKKIKKFKETVASRYIYQNEVDKACFQHGMAYYNFKDLKRRIASEKKLHDKIFQIAEHPKYDGYQCGLA